jgi:hypothetical protein
MTVCIGLRLIASIRTFVEVRLVRVCPEGCPTWLAREMNPESAGTGRAWPALNFPSGIRRYSGNLRSLKCSRARASSLGTRLARQGPPVSADTGRYHFLLGRHGHDREVRSAGGYHPTLSGFPDLRRRGLWFAARKWISAAPATQSICVSSQYGHVSSDARFYGHTTNRTMATDLTKNKGKQKKALLWE